MAQQSRFRSVAQDYLEWRGAKDQAPRGLSRVMAAQYLDLSPGKFDQLVADGRMPPAKRIDGRKV